MSHRCEGKECAHCKRIAESASPGGTPTKGHPSVKRAGGIYVDSKHKDAQSLSYLAMQEGMSEGKRGKDGNEITPKFDELVQKVGKSRARKMVKEAERAWGIPESGLTGWLKRRLG